MLAIQSVIAVADIVRSRYDVISRTGDPNQNKSRLVILFVLTRNDRTHH